MGNRSISIWDGSELELAWSKKSSSYFGNNFPRFLSSGIPNTSIFQVGDVLHWIIFLVMKTFSNIFRSTFYWAGNIWIYFTSHLFSIIANKFHFDFEFLYYYHYLMMLLLILLMKRALFSILLKLNSHHPYTSTSPLQQILKQNNHAFHNYYSVKNKKLLAFNWFLNELLLETKWLEVMLIWRFVSIKLIKSFYSNDSPCNFNLTGKAVPFQLQIWLW